jgi:2-keto-4-pentenoate hydratase/2-oxohepta-3-ene-1,7-dioic acid hydratase in catechol pathway
MKLATYERAGEIHHGVVEGEAGAETVRDIGRGDLLTLLESGDGWLARAREAASRSEPRPLAEGHLRAPIRRPPKLLALAGNYQAHVKEGGVAPVAKDRATPLLFLKPSSAIIAAGEPVRLPAISGQVDYELELGVVLGMRCKDVRAEDALAVVAGYLVANDISARSVDWGVTRVMTERIGYFDWLNGKWPDTFAPLGPFIRTADEVPDPQALAMRLAVNGELRQQASTADMIYSVAETIAFCSRFMTLEPGDIIETGPPSGVGATTGTYLKPGDRIEAWIEGLGTLVTQVERGA